MKKLTQKVALAVLLILFVKSVNCQDNYLTGYILQANGDTLHGFIDYRNWEKNPEKIFFKKNLNQSKEFYTPANIKGFAVLDEHYKSAIVEIEISKDRTDGLTYDSDVKLIIDTTFLQAIIEGSKSLYYLKKDGKEMFYILQDSAFELLVYKKYLKEENGQNVIIENKKYVGQLILYLSNCPGIQQKINNTKYKQTSLEDIFLQYFKCAPSEVQFHREVEKGLTEFGLVAGMSLTTLKFTGDSYFDNLINAGFQSSINFTGGLVLDYVLPRNRGRWSIYNELLYTNYKATGQSSNYINPNYYTINNYTIGYTYLKLNNMARYNFPVGKLIIFLNAGISNGYVIAEKNMNEKEIKFYSTERIEEVPALNDTRKWEIGGIVGVGAKLNHFSFEARYEMSNGMSRYNGLHSAVRSFYFLLGYRF